MYPNYYPGILSRGINLMKSIKWGAVLDGTQKTLGVINQAIPIVYQVKPLFSNAKTLFKIANVMNSPTENTSSSTSQITKQAQNSPIFYI